MMTIDQGLIIAYFASILAIGFYKNSSSNISTFLFAGRKLTIPALVATLVSTWYGAILEIGRFTFKNGISAWFVFGAFYYIAAFIYAKYLSEHIQSSRNDSIPSRFYSSYGKKSALLAIILIFLLASPAPYLKMLAIILSYIWEIDFTYALILGIMFSTMYTLKGGFNSVIKTDILQFILMFLGFGSIIIYLYFMLLVYLIYQILQNTDR